MKLLAIIEDTIREGIARKTILTFFIISTLLLIVGLLVAIFSDIGSIEISTDISEDKAELAREEVVRFVQYGLANLVNLAVVFLSVFATASIIPHTLEKGTIDILLSKPISRIELLFGKFAGSVLVVFLNVAYFIVGMWIITSLEAGFWNYGFLLSILTITFSFMVLFTIMMLIGVAFRSTALSIIIVFSFVLILSPILAAHEDIARLMNNDTVGSILEFFYYIFPKPSAIDQVTLKIILGESFDWEPIWTSGLLAAVMTFLSIVVLKKKEF